MRKILFATTNHNKISRLKNFLGNNNEFEILSFADLNYVIPEPDEFGTGPVQIAENKAKYYWEHLRVKYPVLTQDDTIEFIKNPELAQSLLSIKDPVIEKYGKFTDLLAIEYYLSIAKKYGGKVEMRFNYGFALYSDGLLRGAKANIACALVDEVSEIVPPGYFLTAITKAYVGGKDIYFSEMTVAEKADVDCDLAKAVNSLLITFK